MANKSTLSGYVLGLDVGDKRIGVARASMIAQLPQPLDMIPVNEQAFSTIKTLVEKENVTMVVIGLPRNQEGAETAQSQKVRDFASTLAHSITVPIVFADESLSSVRADELSQHTNFKNVSQDSLAACFILEEFILNYRGGTS